MAFVSYARNLVDSDTNKSWDVFVYDRTTHQTQRVSISATGGQSNDDSQGASISADGRFVAFTSHASNLVRADTNDVQDVFVHDRATHRTRRVSISSNGSQGKSYSYGPSISGTGRYVAFTSDAPNLVRKDTNGKQDVFVHDRGTHQTRRVSISSNGSQGNKNSYAPSISADGRHVAFTSDASTLLRNDTNDTSDVFVRDATTHQTERVSISSAGSQSKSYSFYNSISADGRYVAFGSDARNLVHSDSNGYMDVFVHDRTTGQTQRVSISSAGVQANGSSGYALSLSADGRYVGFGSDASNLVRHDTNGYKDVFVRGPLN